MFLLYLRSDVLFENWRKVAVAVLLNMPSRLQRDVGLAPAFTRICRRRRPLPSWCLKSLFCSGQVAVVAVCVGSHCAPCVGDRYCRLSNDKKFKKKLPNKDLITIFSLDQFHYEYVNSKYGDQAKLLLTDTNGFCNHIQTEDVYKDDMQEDQDLFDTSD